ncbi:MAG: gamma carbonic anhydrase family protein [Planctomycetes bacterium]|jgi:carbonic anhydrase/acetyltransferase-like protein (isoleucine patch superfamily)|nr:gamma carbonic anhydrase family protein [Planctomycetota bacterium]
MARLVRVGGAYVAENAVITGDVTLGAGASVWFFSVLRGDDAPIRIGARTNVQDHAILHADPGLALVVGEEVTIGHRVTIHCAEVGPRCLLGMGAVLLRGARIGEGSIIAAGALVTEGMVVPPRSLVRGLPGRVVADVGEEGARAALHGVGNYLKKIEAYSRGDFDWPR